MATATSNLWDLALTTLRSKLDEESYATWLAPVRFLGYNEGVAHLAVPSDFYRNWLAHNYQDQIEESFSESMQCPVSVQYQIITEDPEDEETARLPRPFAPPAAADAEATRRSPLIQRPSDFVSMALNQNYSFDTFVVGESNRFAHAAALAVADPHSSVYNPLFIYGGVGLGKTHLMQSIGQKLQSYGRHFNILYVSSEAFMNAFIESVAQKRMVEFRNCFRNVDLLMVDDVQFFSAAAEATQIEFFHTFNVLFDAGKKIVISSDHPPKELHQLEERLRSRFEWGLIVDIQPPDLETRVAILRKKGRLIGLDLAPEVTIFIAERIRSNLRKLEGALTRLAAHATMTSQPITIETARLMLGPFLQGEEPKKISVEKIQMAVCNYFNMSLADMTGANRARKFARPRQIASYLSRELTDCSYPDIARKFGGRDHSSIIHAHRKIQTDIGHQLDLQNLVKYLTRVIKEEPTASPQASR